MKRKIILFIITISIMMIFTYSIHFLTLDELWNYGFSYNIAKGAIPYRDFNMVVMPLYSLMMAIPLKIIGNNLFVFYLFNAILISYILTIIDEGKTLNSIFMSIIITLLMNAYGYNCFIMIVLILVLYLEKNSKYKYKNEVIGLLLGCILATKQNIGVVLFIPYILHSKQKLKSICFYLIPITMVGVYLILNNALIECIDYCFLGLKNFTSNFTVQTHAIVVMLIIIIIYLIKIYRETKDVNYLYLLCFQIINYPLIEMYHFSIGIIPLAYYIINNENNRYIRFILYSFFIAVFIFPYSSINYSFELSSIDIYKYKSITENVDNELKNMKKFIDKNQDSRIFIFSKNAYFIKIAMHEKLDKFDLINKGNMGKYEEKYIDDIEKICKKQKCLFVISKSEFEDGSQLNPIIKNYVIKNYQYCGKTAFNQSYYCNRK